MCADSLWLDGNCRSVTAGMQLPAGRCPGGGAGQPRRALVHETRLTPGALSSPHKDHSSSAKVAPWHRRQIFTAAGTTRRLASRRSLNAAEARIPGISEFSAQLSIAMELGALEHQRILGKGKVYVRFWRFIVDPRAICSASPPQTREALIALRGRLGFLDTLCWLRLPGKAVVQLLFGADVGPW